MPTDPPLDYATPAEDRGPVYGPPLAFLACLAGAFATFVPMRSLVEMLRVPAGSTIRPMTQVHDCFFGIVVGVCVVWPLAIAADTFTRRQRTPRRWSIAALLAAAASLVANPVLFFVILSARRLALAD